MTRGIALLLTVLSKKWKSLAKQEGGGAAQTPNHTTRKQSCANQRTRVGGIPLLPIQGCTRRDAPERGRPTGDKLTGGRGLVPGLLSPTGTPRRPKDSCLFFIITGSTVLLLLTLRQYYYSLVLLLLFCCWRPTGIGFEFCAFVKVGGMLEACSPE